MENAINFTITWFLMAIIYVQWKILQGSLPSNKQRTESWMLDCVNEAAIFTFFKMNCTNLSLSHTESLTLNVCGHIDKNCWFATADSTCCPQWRQNTSLTPDCEGDVSLKVSVGEGGDAADVAAFVRHFGARDEQGRVFHGTPTFKPDPACVTSKLWPTK